FGGSADTIRNELAVRHEQYPSSASHEVPQMVAWLTTRLSNLSDDASVRAGEDLARAEKLAAAEAIIKRSQSERKKWLSTAAPSAVLVLALVYAISWATPDWYFALTFLAILAAGATGATTRSLLSDQAPDVGPRAPLLLGAIAGLVVGCSYLIPQWMGAPGALVDPNAAAIDTSDNVQLVSVTLVAISAGAGFDTVFGRLRRQADQHPVGVSGADASS
ncbi:MAG: hypothetical protein AAFU79_17890, partial [Myxococcota bacterium]